MNCMSGIGPMSRLSIYGMLRIYVLAYHFAVWRMQTFPNIVCRWKRYRSLDKTLFFRKRTCDGLSFIQHFWCLDGGLLFWQGIYLSLLFDFVVETTTHAYFWCHLGITPQQHEQPVHWACRVWQLRLVFERPMFPKPFHPLSTESKRLGGQNFKPNLFLFWYSTRFLFDKTIFLFGDD